MNINERRRAREVRREIVVTLIRFWFALGVIIGVWVGCVLSCAMGVK